MSRIEEHSDERHEELIFPCDCHDSHYLRLSWDNTEPTYRYLWIEQHDRPFRWQRLSHAWKCLLGKDYQQTELVLSDKVIDALREFFNSRQP